MDRSYCTSLIAHASAHIHTHLCSYVHKLQAKMCNHAPAPTNQTLVTHSVHSLINSTLLEKKNRSKKNTERKKCNSCWCVNRVRAIESFPALPLLLLLAFLTFRNPQDGKNPKIGPLKQQQSFWSILQFFSPPYTMCCVCIQLYISPSLFCYLSTC